MSILKAIRDRLGDSTTNMASGFRSILPPWGSSYISRYILDYSSRVTALGLDGPPALSLAGHSFTFADGRWVSSGPGESSNSRPRLRRLQRRRQALEDENRELKHRVETLTEALTEATARLEAMRRERRIGKRPPPRKVTLGSQ